jgi:WD40 repeat protein
VPGSRTLIVGGGPLRSAGPEFLVAVDTGAGHRVTQLRGHQGAALAPTISADGRTMVTSNLGTVAMLWRLESGRPVGPPRPYSPSGFEDLALSPDGRTLAVLLPGTGIKLVDAATLRHRAMLVDSDDVRSFARFTEDGRHIVASTASGFIRIWSADGGRAVAKIYAGGADEFLRASMSPDDRMLATGSLDGTARVFDVQTGRPLALPLPGLPSGPVIPLFTPDGAYLLAVTASGPSYRWDMRASSWMRHACAVAGRSLTRSEWNEALPGRDYAPACS